MTRSVVAEGQAVAQPLTDKIVMVTGAASGIGRASAALFAERGAKVIVSDRDVAGGEETVAAIERAGGVARFVALDVTEGAQVQAAVDFAVRAFGRLDGAFNNAGFSGPNASFVDLDDATYARTMDVNVKSVWLCMRAQLRQMRAQGGGGSIVNTASAGGLRGMAKQAVYSASKHAVIGLTKSAALEFARSGSRVNAICPGVVETPMTRGILNGDERLEKAFLGWQPSGRFGRPEEIGEAAAWLLSDAASFVTGIAMSVDGGVMA